jgi:hypothetical protein
MQDSWLDLVSGLLRPARPRLEQCLRERELHLDGERLVEKERARAIADCERRIEDARTRVFAANDGVVSSRMTELEQEWRRASRLDPEHGMMNLWARVAPSSWLDRKRWRDSDTATSVDAAIALASDVDGVEAAESAVDSLRVALADWGTRLGARIQWHLLATDADCASVLLAESHRFARESMATHDAGPLILERATALERAVYDAALGRFPERPLLATGVAHAAFVDWVLEAGAPSGRANPVTPLRSLWKAGYTIARFDSDFVTLELPRLP